MNLDSNIQQVFPQYATNDPTVQIPISTMDQNAELIIKPLSTFRGFIDGYANDNLRNFSVQLDSSEQWIYRNGDNADAHPLHFHLTSGYVDPSNPVNTPGLVSRAREYVPYLYSMDTYAVGPQQTIAFNLTFPNYSGQDTAEINGSVPPNTKDSFRGLGNCIHCHFLTHVSDNSMMIQYYVFKGERSNLFK